MSVEIQYIVGDATRPVGEGAKIIAHVCNDVGGWGKGFVLAVSRRWREPEREYREWWKGRRDTPFVLGQVQFVAVGQELWVANIIGQRGLRAVRGVPPIRYEAIREGLGRIAAFAVEKGASVHMPRIGCGLAGGVWSEIEPLIKETLIARGVPVTVYDLKR